MKIATCKIKGCRAPIYRANLCEPMYEQWLTTGVLPGPVKQKQALGSVRRPHPTVRARRERQQQSTHKRLLAAADRLYAAALALPDVVRSHALRTALGSYHTARKALEGTLMPTKEKTWTQIEGEIADTFRKWQRMPPTLTYQVQKRSAAKRIQTKEERTVAIEFSLWRGGQLRKVKLVMGRHDRAIENLEAIAKAVEHMRMAEVRKVTDLVVLMYQQLYPVAAPTPPPPPPGVGSSGPYAVLHVASTAPLAVCEAAYRALAKLAHPDQGGSTQTMQRLNAAIETIRKEKAK